MNWLYLCTFSVEVSDGVGKKILGQIEAFKKENLRIDLLEMDREKFYLNKNNLEKRKYKKELKDLYIFLKKNNNFLKDYSVIYIRYSINPYLYLCLRLMKKHVSKIIVEIPTYPYKGEIKLNNKYTAGIKIFVDKILRSYFLKKYVSRIVTFSEDKEISGVKCINISNGLSVLNTQNIRHIDNGKLNFISVSNLHSWHGVDRFLFSLKKYYEIGGKEDILFHVVGTGKTLERCKKISETKELQNRIIFYGRLEGKELDKVYKKTNIAVGSLGRHRSGVYTMKALKNREYAAKGLPMIFSENDLDFTNVDFVYKVKSDESLIDIKDIIRWYENLKISSEEIRKFSEKFSWDIQMKKITEEIKKL